MKKQKEEVKLSPSSNLSPDGLLRHDFALMLAPVVSETQVGAILEDLEDNLLYHRLLKKPLHTVLFLGYSNQDIMLQEAERLGLLKEKRKPNKEAQEARNRLRKEQEEYLHHRIIKAERKKPFKVAKKELFEGGNFESILTEADKTRIIHSIISNCKALN